MPLFPNVSGNAVFNGKSHTGLVVSEGNAPAEKLIVSKDEKVKFPYAYGPKGNQNVVIAKGKVVELGTPEYDGVTERYWPTIKTADVNSKNAVGVNHHNLYEVKRDRFSGNQATVITRSFIEVPLFEHADTTVALGMADAMNYGAAYGLSNDLKPGDYVKVGAKVTKDGVLVPTGLFTKLDTATDSAFEIVGQVWGVERELPPAGFLQYYLDLEIDEINQFFKNASYAPSPGSNGPIVPNGSNDVGAYPSGYPWTLHKWKGDFERLLNPTINKGIPFLTDGYFKAKTPVNDVVMNDIYDATTNNDGQIERVDFSGSVTFGHYNGTAFVASAGNAVDAGVETAADTRNNALFIKLRNQLDPGEVDRVTVYYTDANGVKKTFGANDIHIDANPFDRQVVEEGTNNTVVVYLEPGTTYREISMDLKLVINPVAGIPTEWDYAGSVGAVRILLQR